MIKKLLISAVKLYRKDISPYKGCSCCRFSPSCSEYTLQALEKYGALRGSVKSAKRILRCNPLSKGGYDPLD